MKQYKQYFYGYLLTLVDWLFSSHAFKLGVEEANPLAQGLMYVVGEWGYLAFKMSILVFIFQYFHRLIYVHNILLGIVCMIHFYYAIVLQELV